MSEDAETGLRPEELDAEQGEPLPEREAMSIVDVGLDPGPMPLAVEKDVVYEAPVEPRT